MKKHMFYILFSLLWPISVFAANYQLATVPLYLGNSVEANIFFELDDSGSMDWEILTKKYWNYCAYDPDGGGDIDDSSNCGGNEVDNGLMRIYDGSGWSDFEYLFDNDDDAYSNNCASSRETVELCASSDMDQEWRVKSSDVNILYYNPAVTYTPWVGKSDASFTAARSDPESTSTGYTDTRSLDGFVYHVWKDTHGWTASDPKPYRGSNRNRTVGENGVVDLWDEHIKYTINGSSLQANTITYSPTNNDIGETSSSTSTITGSNTDSYGRTVAETKTNIANWYQYYRKRSYVTKAAVALVITNSPSFRYGLSVINKENDLFKEVPASTDTAPFLTHNDDIINSLYQFNWPSSSTPLRQGLELVGKYYDTAITTNPDTGGSMADPIISSCQQNFTVLFTDGYWNGSDPASAIADADADGNSLMLADVAKYYYDKDLSSLTNEVLANAFDPATYQHMVTFTVAFGIQGLLSDSDGSGWPDTAGSDLLENGNWGDPSNSNPEKIDDLWHAGFNSKGKFVSASTPQDVVKSLEDAIVNIADRTSTAASVALNSSALSSDTLIFQSRFDSDTWAGELFAVPINADGSIGSVSWNAATELNSKAYTSRVIMTHNGTKGIPFVWPVDYTIPTANELTASQTTLLLVDKPVAYNTTLLTQTYGSKLISYLRGDDTNVGTTDIPRDNRTGKLGDIVNSAPFYVTKPRFRYPDNWVDISKLSGVITNTVEPEDSVAYSSFKTTQDSRSKMLYVGANDGMLHGFFAEKTARNSHTPGEELIAYVPASLFANLSKLFAQPFDHYYFVDGAPVVGDVMYSSAWHSILLGSLGAGGQGIFALDVTSPDSFAENQANNIVRWEFTDSNDADMGYSFSQPSIVRLHNGKWAAVFGNGYNNTVIDSYYSQDDDGTTDTSTQGDEGQAVLYIVDIETGVLIKKLETLIGTSDPASGGLPNGLSSPAAIDVDGDHITDYIYAGDLYGNLWKFDVNDSDVANWVVSFSGEPLFTACAGVCGNTNHQPITVRPQIGVHPNQNGYLVYFGTGKYFDSTDNSATGQTTQSFYGIWDKAANWSAFSRTNLLEQKILKEITQAFDTDSDGVNDTNFELRYSSSETINWSSHNGWFMDLINNNMNTYSDTPTNTNNFGERQVFNPVLRNGKIIFTTLLPSTSSCDFGGDSWLMELDAFSGASLTYSPFDLNNNNNFDADDFVNVGDIDGDGQDDYVPVSGKKNKNGIAPTPGILSDGDSEIKISAGSDGSIETTIENPGPSGYGRQSWNELL